MGRLGIPFVWNAGTTATVPPAFLRFMSPKAALYEAGRIGRIRLALPATRRVTVSPNTAVITSSPDDRWEGGASTHGLLVGALTQEELALCGGERPASRRPFRAACIGRLLGFKGFDLAIRSFAAARCERPDLELWVIGTGPERGHLEQLAGKLGCSQHVRFLGWMARSDTLAALKEVDVILAPSLREQNARYAILEGMASGVPTICLDVGGPGLFPSEAGREIPFGRPDSVVNGLTAALLSYASDPVARADAGARARQHAQTYWSWDAMTDRIRSVYETLLRGSL
jgi:glycosyltransferase involved in cell wall biosynthesis